MSRQHGPNRRQDLQTEAERLRASLKSVAMEMAELPPDPDAPDLTGTTCETCERGIYVERWTDDWEGLLHCSACFTEVPKWRHRT